MFKSTPENKKRKHSKHFLHHQEPLGSQRADRTYCTSNYGLIEHTATGLEFSLKDEIIINAPPSSDSLTKGQTAGQTNMLVEWDC